MLARRSLGGTVRHTGEGGGAKDATSVGDGRDGHTAGGSNVRRVADTQEPARAADTHRADTHGTDTRREGRTHPPATRLRTPSVYPLGRILCGGVYP